MPRSPSLMISLSFLRSPGALLVLASLAWPLHTSFSKSNLEAGNILAIRLDLEPGDGFLRAWINERPCELQHPPGLDVGSYLLFEPIDLESPPPHLSCRFQTARGSFLTRLGVRGPSRIPTGFVQLAPSGKITLLSDADGMRRENQFFFEFFRQRFTPELLARGPWVLPVPERAVGSIFGKLREYDNGARSYHKGVDFSLDHGTPIFAANRGRVCHSGLGRLRGELVIIDHGAGILTSYWHLSKRVVFEGDWVVAGQKVGEIGTTGLSTGPHLHFEARAGATLVDGLNLVDLPAAFTP